MYFPRNSEFGSAVSKLRKFGCPPPGTPLLRAVGTDVTVLSGSRNVRLWNIVSRYQRFDAV
jgi:hypothetical protein